uniref:anthocyanidin 3-O-glucosyltransferase n=1 Tax=Populus trichocarpa TaxID=3694 RepID=A0A2K2BWY6_POPTR
MGRDIYVVTGPGQGHLRPCMHLCNLLNKRNYHTTLVLSSTLSSVIPPTFAQNPLTTIAQIAPSSRPLPGCDLLSQQAAEDLRAHLSNRCGVPDLPLPICAIIDFQLGWTGQVFRKFNVPVIGLFTFGASAAAMEWGAWKVQAGDIKPGETRLVPGLPEEMAITYWDLKRKELGPPGGMGRIPGGAAHQDRVTNLHGSQKLKGREVRPSVDEYKQLADALEDWSRPFTWVVQHDKDHRPDPGLLKRGGNRGLIIYGWAPQMMILSHESTGGFLSHCGWNSTMEAVGHGVPVLAWPIRGDQYYDAKLVVNYLKVGYRVADDLSEMVKRDDIVKGLERLMGDEEMRDRMVGMKSIFDNATPEAAFDSFSDFVNQKLKPA